MPDPTTGPNADSAAPAAAPAAATPGHGPLATMMVGAAGVVFGDIGTSPLYTMKTVLALSGGGDPAAAIGVLSLLVWTLFVITTLKYVLLAMRFDNAGEGGILALMARLAGGRHRRPAIVAIGLVGAALIYGDGAITPAISVLSAIEGLRIAAPAVGRWVLPLAVAILAGLFLAQPLGTARIGRAFGPVMIAWFAAIALLGVRGLALHPGVLVALNPWYAVAWLAGHGLHGFLLLGGVFLCVTGAEALYADMGHFGARPIRLAWIGLVFPALVLNYAGQAALVATGAPVGENIFFALAPAPLLLPLVGLATVATVIASQSIITGAYSMTRQAIMLGWLPRLTITQTSSAGYGQIYVGAVNWLLMLVTIGLALGFRKSDNLAAAYGIAVSLTMLMTTCLLFLAMREIRRWPLPVAGAIAAGLLAIDLAFVGANAMKLTDGGYIPLVLAALVYLLMWTWHHGAAAITRIAAAGMEAPAAFLARLAAQRIARVPGTAVFFTRTADDVPPILVWHVRHNKALHDHVLILRTEVASVPAVGEAARCTVVPLGAHLWRAELAYGYMEQPDIPAAFARHIAPACAMPAGDVTYYLGHDTVIAGDAAHGPFRWLRPLFMALVRNSARKADYLRLPTDRVVELGRAIEI